MKVKLNADEIYPCYDISTNGTYEVDVPEETVQRWKRVMAEFEVVQLEMDKAIEAAKAEERR